MASSHAVVAYGTQLFVSVNLVRIVVHVQQGVQYSQSKKKEEKKKRDERGKETPILLTVSFGAFHTVFSAAEISTSGTLHKASGP